MSVKTSVGSPRAHPSQPRAAGVNSAWVRRVNAVLLLQALRRHPGSSQRELAVLTGLDKATVSAVTTQLVGSGYVARNVGSATVRRLGRPAVALSIPPSAGTVFGVRLEPDRIAVVAADLGGRVTARASRPGSVEPARALKTIAAAVAALGQSVGAAPQRAIGVTAPGLVDHGGRLLVAPNLGWRNVPLAAMAADLLPAPVVIDNDANAAALAEREFGKGVGIDDFIYLNGHSGVGGAVVIGGNLYRGADGLAGEFGHIRVVPDGRVCGCGARGCMEAYASVPGLIESISACAAAPHDMNEVAMRAHGGEAPVLAVLAQAGDLVGRALAGTVNALNPSHLVIGGEIALVAPFMLTALRRSLARAAMEPVAARINIEFSPLGADAVLMGGITLALQKVDADLVNPTCDKASVADILRPC